MGVAVTYSCGNAFQAATVWGPSDTAAERKREAAAAAAWMTWRSNNQCHNRSVTHCRMPVWRHRKIPRSKTNRSAKGESAIPNGPLYVCTFCNIHPASRGVAAHTASLFRSVRGAKGGFPPWGLPKLRIFTSPPWGLPKLGNFHFSPPWGLPKLGNFHFSPPWGLPKLGNFHFSPSWGLPKLGNFHFSPPWGLPKLGNFHFSPPWQLPKLWNFHFSLPWRLSKLRNFK